MEAFANASAASIASGTPSSQLRRKIGRLDHLKREVYLLSNSCGACAWFAAAIYKTSGVSDIWEWQVNWFVILLQFYLLYS
jgi:hypothetical protein